MEQNSIAPRIITILLITGLLVWAYFQSGIRLGQDLKGGTTLRFALDIEGAKKSGRISNDADPAEIVDKTLEIISDRIDKHGLAEIQLTQYGDNKFIVSLPAGAAAQADGIIDVISQLGDLKFRIEVKPDSYYRSRALRANEDPPVRKGVWTGTDEEFEAFLKSETEVWKTARARGEEYKPKHPLYMVVKSAKANTFHIIERKSGPVNFDGGILTNPRAAEDQNRRKPVVLYDVKNQFQNDFGAWTEANIRLPMAIILNNEYHSAPIIQDKLSTNVQISLGDGLYEELQQEAKTLATVLQTGSLKIQPTLEARNVVGPSLAGQSRDRGIMAILVAFGLVLVFMIFYYRANGIVANIALLLNLVLLVGFLAFFQAVLTLPGIAGIVLTVGMAVDANILINERIREERRGGRSLARAVAEGYDRALSAIIDANVTSIITAIFLYNFGSGPVRGFAVTLAIGLIVSMFTAIFVTRTIVDWLMRAGIMKDLSAFGSGEPPKVKWLSMRRVFAPISVAGIVFGLLMFAGTDRYTLYDIDFTGGYKLQADFTEPTTPDQVAELLSKTKMNVSIQVTDFNEEGDKETRTVTREVGPYPDAQVVSAGDSGKGVEINVQRLFKTKGHEDEQASAFREYMRLVLKDRLMPEWDIEPLAPYVHKAEEGETAGSNPLADFAGGGMTAVLAFRDPDALLSAETLKSVLETDMPFWTREDGRDVPNSPASKGLKRTVRVDAHPSPSAGVATYRIYMKSTTAGGQPAETDSVKLRQRMAEFLGGKGLKDSLKKRLQKKDFGKLDNFSLSQPFPSEDAIGSTVAERLRDDAIVALFLSLIGIIIYIALRFRSRAMGFAAVLCLFHDVAITLGLVAVANSLGLVDAKLNLAMVAAFLTLVGYSVNDTVVIFDRIRENRGKRRTIDAALINMSINQTLARTLRTTATFLLVCVALFVFNYGQRNVLEGFAFLLILGSVIGTYSTLAISAPLLIYLPWLWERVKGFAPKGSLVTNCLTNVATMILTPVMAVLWLVWALLFAAGAFIAGLVMFVPWAMSSNDADEVVTA